MKVPLLFLYLCFLSCAGDSAPAAVKGQPRNDSSPTPPQTMAAANPFAAIDVSGMDVSYFPPDYPVLKMTGKITTPPLARVIYSRPHKGGRKIFGDLLPYNQPWRLGANEASEIELFKPAMIQGKKIAAGRYIIYCIPDAAQWQVVFNTNTFSWGLKPDRTKDVAVFTVPVEKMVAPVEFFTMVFQPEGNNATLVMTWDEVLVKLPISFQ